MNPYNPFTTKMMELGEYIDKSPDLIKSIISKKSEYVKKWLPIIKHSFDDLRLTDEILENICLYCEICNTYYESMRQVGLKLVGNELSGILKQIRTKILNKEPKRSEVKSKVYNYQTGFMEYELADGNFIKIVNESVIGLRLDVSKDIFCEEFVKHLDINSYRDNRIDKIL
jgi:hypothetical protein